MMKATGFYPRIRVDTRQCRAVSQAGGILLTDIVRGSGLDAALSAGLARWRKPTSVHDPAKIICDLAVSLAFGRGLPGRHRGAARRARRVRPGGLRRHGVEDHRRIGR